MPPPQDWTSASIESPPSLKGRKLFDEEYGRRIRAHIYYGGGRRHKMLTSSVVIFISVSMLHMFYWRAPLLSYLSEGKVTKEQEVDAWNLLRKDTELLRSREAMRKARRRDNKMSLQGNGRRAFTPIPKPRLKPLDFEPLPGISYISQSKSIRMIHLDVKSMYLQSKITKLQPWLIHNTTYSDEPEDEPEDLTRSQTVVYENDRECVPMADWQTTFHVRLILVAV